MIIGIGIDTIRVRDLSFEFIQNNFTQTEREYCEESDKEQILELPKWEGYAAVLAAKEAFKKALGLAFLDIPMLDIEVQRDDNNRPAVHLCCPEKYNLVNVNYIVHISLTRATDFATAMVVVEEHGNTWFNRLFKGK